MTERIPAPDEHYDDFLVTQIARYKMIGNKVMEQFCQNEYDQYFPGEDMSWDD